MERQPANQTFKGLLTTDAVAYQHTEGLLIAALRSDRVMLRLQLLGAQRPNRDAARPDIM